MTTLEGGTRERVGSRWEEELLIGFDLETTGVDRFCDRPVAAAFVDACGRTVLRRQYRVIDPGVEVPEGAVLVHGISTRAARMGIGLLTAARRFVSIFEAAAFRGHVIVGMNLAYDLTMVDALVGELLGETISTLPLRVADVLVIDRHLDPYRRGSRRLAELCAHYGVVHHRAHDALGDVEATLGVFAAQLESYPELSSMDPTELTEHQATWHATWAQGYSAWRVAHGQAPLSSDEHLWPIAARSTAPDFDDPSR